MSLSLADVLEITVHGAIFDMETVNVFHYEVSDATGAPTLAGAIAAFNTAFKDSWRNCVSADWTWAFTRAQVIKPLPRGMFVDEVGGQQGLIESDSCPPATAVVIRKRTAIAGRANRGRVYVCGLPESAHVGGKILSDFHGVWQNLTDKVDDVLSITGGGALTPVIFHRAIRTFEIIKSAAFDRVVRSQRRREVGVGS